MFTLQKILSREWEEKTDWANIAKDTSDRGLLSKLKICNNSTLRKQTIWIKKNGPKILKDTLWKKMNRWKINIYKKLLTIKCHHRNLISDKKHMRSHCLTSCWFWPLGMSLQYGVKQDHSWSVSDMLKHVTKGKESNHNSQEKVCELLWVMAIWRGLWHGLVFLN